MSYIRVPATNPHEQWNPVKVKQKVTTPVPKTVEDLFPSVDRWAIGFDQMFNTLRDVSGYKQTTYPPYNLGKSEDTYVLELAVAGFKREEINIEVADQKLVISSQTESSDSELEVLHQGIAKRDWELNFALSEHIEVESAQLKDGILTVTLVNVVPEHLKPKTIKIK